MRLGSAVVFLPARLTTRGPHLRWRAPPPGEPFKTPLVSTGSADPSWEQNKDSRPAHLTLPFSCDTALTEGPWGPLVFWGQWTFLFVQLWPGPSLTARDGPRGSLYLWDCSACQLSSVLWATCRLQKGAPSLQPPGPTSTGVPSGTHSAAGTRGSWRQLCSEVGSARQEVL